MALKPLGPIGGGSSGGKGGLKPLGPLGGGKGGSSKGGSVIASNKPTKKQAKKVLETQFDKGGGGIGGLISEAGGIIGSVPSAIMHLGTAGYQEAKKGTFRLHASGIEESGTTQAAGGRTTKEAVAEAQHAGGEQVGVAKAGWEQRATPEMQAEHPLIAGQAQSFRNTFEDVKDPERLADAYEEGHLLGKLLEDSANISLVAGGVAKGLDLGVGGQFSRVQEAQQTAEAAGKAVEAGEKAAMAAAKQGIEHDAAVTRIAEETRGSGLASDNQAWRDAKSLAGETRQKASDALEGVEDLRRTQLSATRIADDLAASTGPLYGAYRTSIAMARLTGQGAGLPNKPFELALKGAGKLGEWVKSLPRLNAAIANFDENYGFSRAIRNMGVRKGAARIQGEVEGRAAIDSDALGKGLEAVRKAGGDDDVALQASLMVSAGIAEAVEGPIGLLGRGGDQARQLAGEMLNKLADRLHYDPEAIRMALAYVRKQLPDADAARIDAINGAWDQHIAPVLEQWMTTQQKGRRAFTLPDEEAYNRWNLSDDLTETPPGARARVEKRAERRLNGLIRDAEKQQKRVNKSAESAGVTPGASGLDARNEAAASAVEGATGRGSLGSLRRVQRTARAEGRAQVARPAQERFNTLRSHIPRNVPDEAIQGLVDAVTKMDESRTRLTDAAGEEAAQVAGQGERAASQGAVAKEIRAIRQDAVDVVDAELTTLSDLPDTIPFIPGDLSEYHGSAHDQVAQADTGIRPYLDRVRGLKGKNRPTTEGEVWVRAYNMLWKKLPAAIKTSFEKLSDDEIRDLQARDQAGTVTAMVGGLDEMAAVHLGDRASGVPDEDVGAFIDDFSRKARLREFKARAKGQGARWGPEMIDLFRDVVQDPDAVAMLDDPIVREALSHTNLRDAAANVAALRGEAAEQQSARGAFAGLPEKDAIHDLLADQPIGSSNAELEGMVYEMGPEGQTLVNEWIRNGGDQVEGSLEKELFRLEEGQPPTWREQAVDEHPEGLAALRQSEEARSEVTDILAEHGGQSLRPELGREAGVLGSQATAAEKVVAQGEGAEQELIGSLTEQGARKGVGAGRKLVKYEKNLKELHLTQQAIEDAPEWLQQQLDGLYNDVTNTPARARPALIAARSLSRDITKWVAEMEKSDEGLPPDVAAAAQAAIEASIKDVRDLYANVAGADGEITRHPLIDPKFRLGGQPLTDEGELPRGLGGAPSAKKPLRVAKSGEQIKRETPLMPRSLNELKVVMKQRVERHVTNEVARSFAAGYGRRAQGILGDEAGGDIYSTMKPEDIAAEMDAREMVPWDPAKLLQRVDPASTGPATLWIPKTLMKSIEDYYGPGGRLERWMRKWYDKPITFWKAAVLALRPAWHVNNVLSNSLMSMVGSGMSPLEYASRMRQAHAILSGKETGRSGLVLDELEQPTVEALGGRAHLQAPGRVVEGKAGAALTQPGELQSLLDEPGKLRKFVDKSYELNGAVDDMNRLAVFLHEHATLSDADLLNMAARVPELRGLGMKELRTEGAIRMSLKVAGDFLRMTPVERQVFRRVLPFYVWMRHITQLTLRLPTFHPARTVWFLHIAEMMGAPGEYGLAQAYPTGGSGILQIPNISPFGDASESADPMSLGFSVSPVAKLGVGALTGLDLNKFTQFQRPPGQPGGYGGDPNGKPLIDTGLKSGSPGVNLGELANLIGGQFPQVRAARGFVDQQLLGKPVSRYTLGQPRRHSKATGGALSASGEPQYGPLLRFLGLPYERKASDSAYEQHDLKQMLKELQRSPSRSK